MTSGEQSTDFTPVALSSETSLRLPSDAGLIARLFAFSVDALSCSALTLPPLLSISATIFSFTAPWSSSKLCVQLLAALTSPPTFSGTEENMPVGLSSWLWMLPGLGHLPLPPVDSLPESLHALRCLHAKVKYSLC